jgi:hypothetical protein
VAWAKTLKRRFKIVAVILTRILGERRTVVKHGAVRVGIPIAGIEFDGFRVVGKSASTSPFISSATPRSL